MPVATTWAAPASLEVKLDRIWSCTWRLLTEVGSTRSSGSPSSMCRNGRPRITSRATTDPPMITGRRMTAMARRCQNPSPTSFGAARLIDHLSMRGPRAARAAGSTTTETRPASATTAMPA